MYYLLVVLLAFVNTLSNLLVKLGASKIETFSSKSGDIVVFIYKLITNWYLISGLALFGAGFVLWVVILNKVQLSVAAPIMSLAYVFVMIFSYFLFKEPITGIKVIGVILILTGVVFITR